MSRKDLIAWLEREGYKAESCSRMLRRLISSGIIVPSPHIPGHFVAPS
jgi:hypothetical protein